MRTFNELLNELLVYIADLQWFREMGLHANSMLSFINAHDAARDIMMRATNCNDRSVDSELVARLRELAAGDSCVLIVEPALRALGV